MIGLCRSQPRLNRLGLGRRALHERGHILRRQGFDAWLVEEAQVARQWMKRSCQVPSPVKSRYCKAIAVAAAGIDVHLHIGDAGIQHGREIFIGPHGMDLVLPAGAGDEGWRRIFRDRRRPILAGPGGREQRRARIDRSRRNPAASSRPPADRWRRRSWRSNSGYWIAAAMVSSAPAEKPATPILCGSIFHSAAWARTSADRLLEVIDAVGLGLIAVAAQAVAQDDGVDAVLEEIGHRIGAFQADHQSAVAAAGRQDDGGAGIVARPPNAPRSRDCGC